MLKQLREQQARIATNARAKFNEITDETPAERAAEIEREFDAMMAEHDRIGERIARAERLERIERERDAPDPRRPRGEDLSVRGDDDGSNQLSYRTVFHSFLARGGDLSALSAEEREVLRQGANRDPEVRVQTAGTTTAGGYTVPVELAAEIDRAMAMWGPMYDEDICTTLNTVSGNTFNIPTVNDTAKSAGIHTEGTQATDDNSEDATFGQASIGAYVYDTEWVKVSMELLQDSILNMEALLGSLLGERLGRIANSKLTTGSGSSDVKGIVTAASLGKTLASTTAITSDEVIDFLHSVDPAYRASPKARFMFNDTTLSALRKLKDGQGNYLWQMGDVTKGVPGTLLGHYYSINQAMASPATGAKIMLFGDFSKFYVRKVGSPIIGVARERFFPDLGMLGLARFDGEISHSGAIKYMANA